MDTSVGRTDSQTPPPGMSPYIGQVITSLGLKGLTTFPLDPVGPENPIETRPFTATAARSEDQVPDVVANIYAQLLSESVPTHWM